MRRALGGLVTECKLVDAGHGRCQGLVLEAIRPFAPVAHDRNAAIRLLHFERRAGIRRAPSARRKIERLLRRVLLDGSAPLEASRQVLHQPARARGREVHHVRAAWNTRRALRFRALDRPEPLDARLFNRGRRLGLHRCRSKGPGSTRAPRDDADGFNRSAERLDDEPATAVTLGRVVRQHQQKLVAGLERNRHGEDVTERRHHALHRRGQPRTLIAAHHTQRDVTLEDLARDGKPVRPGDRRAQRTVLETVRPFPCRGRHRERLPVKLWPTGRARHHTPAVHRIAECFARSNLIDTLQHDRPDQILHDAAALEHRQLPARVSRRRPSKLETAALNAGGNREPVHTTPPDLHARERAAGFVHDVEVDDRRRIVRVGLEIDFQHALA